MTGWFLLESTAPLILQKTIAFLNEVGMVLLVLPDANESFLKHRFTIGDKLSAQKARLFSYFEAHK